MNEFDNGLAISEGWDLLECAGRVALQRIDDPSADDLEYDEPKFESDTDAIIFVALKAHEGSTYHRHALDLIGMSVWRPL